MLREDKENAASWGISFGVHLVILMLVAATGLFQAVSTESPVDVFASMGDGNELIGGTIPASDEASEVLVGDANSDKE